MLIDLSTDPRKAESPVQTLTQGPIRACEKERALESSRTFRREALHFDPVSQLEKRPSALLGSRWM